MEQRPLGATGLRVSVLGFGCGSVGGLMVRGAAADQERAIARALELGINYFDTAPRYGNGESEKNLGRALRRVGANPLVGTKLRLDSLKSRDIENGIVASLDASLARLGRGHVDLLQLHDRISTNPSEDALQANIVLDVVVPTLQRLRSDGKIRAFGITALGDTQAIHKVIDSSGAGTAQVVYNLLNPTAGSVMPEGYPAQNFENLLASTRRAGMGALAIRVLAAGALGDSDSRHALGSSTAKPMGSGSTYEADLRRAEQFKALVAEGYGKSLTEIALRFALANTDLSTTLIGLSSLEQLDIAASAIGTGPLPAAARDRIAEVQSSFIGQPR